MLHILTSYIKFLWNSTNSHGVHSPFVFDLVRKCFYDKTGHPECKILTEYRNALLQNKDIIEVTDFGAGSRVFKSNARAIDQIAKNAGLSAKDAEMLFRVVRYFQSAHILEIGTSLGLGTASMSLGNPKSKITTLEGCGETAKVAQFQFQKFNCNVNLVVTEFDNYLNGLQLSKSDFRLSTFDFQLIYFDGNHSEKATLRYFELLLPTITNETVWIFDDIHWSAGMEKAWETIKRHPKVTVTIDTFQWGMVFFRQEQQKENFVIRTANSKVLDGILGIRKLWGLLS